MTGSTQRTTARKVTGEFMPQRECGPVASVYERAHTGSDSNTTGQRSAAQGDRHAKA